MLTRGHNRYTCGPTVAVEKRFVEDSLGILDTKFVHDMPVCHSCRLKRYVDEFPSFVSAKGWTGVFPPWPYASFMLSSDSTFHSVDQTPGLQPYRHHRAILESETCYEW